MGEFSVLITDTVGFIKNIPTTLIEAFKSTLENAVDADIILIVCDALTDWMIQLETTNQMLDELKCSGKRLIVFNKCENITDFSHYPHEAVFISAKEKKGLDGLIIRLRSFLEDNYSKLSLKIPYNLLSEFYSLQNYLESVQVEYLNEFVLANIVVNKTSLSKFNKFNQK